MDAYVDVETAPTERIDQNQWIYFKGLSKLYVNNKGY